MQEDAVGQFPGDPFVPHLCFTFYLSSASLSCPVTTASLSARNGPYNPERFCPRRDRLGQRGVRGLKRKILLTGRALLSLVGPQPCRTHEPQNYGHRQRLSAHR